MEYLTVIKTAFILFPVLAFLITIPYILHQYHKYGSVYWFRSLIIYSFILYLLIAYFLVILPLPSIEDVLKLTSQRISLIPFSFIFEFINKSGLILSNTSTYIKAITSATFYVPIFNIFLTLPFGIYLRYYFKKDLKQTILYTFLLSLFFEITQVSGLYFIYPRGYRLFDIDDLILNTLGGLFGFYISNLFIKFLPSRNEIDDKALNLGMKVSKLRRITSFCLDLFIVSSIILFTYVFSNSKVLIYLVLFIYYLIIPLKNNQTLANKFLNIKLDTKSNKLKPLNLILRKLIFFISYIVIPLVLIYSSFNVIEALNKSVLYNLMTLLIVFIYYLFNFLIFLIRNSMFYEIISKTNYVSTILI